MYVYKKLAVSGSVRALHSCCAQDQILQTYIHISNICISMPGSPFFNFMLNFKRSFSPVNPSATMLRAPPRFLCVELYKAQTESMLLLLVRVVVSRCHVLTSLFLIVFLNFFFFLSKFSLYEMDHRIYFLNQMLSSTTSHIQVLESTACL